MATAPPQDAPTSPDRCFLEAHYYSGGLRMTPLAVGGQRPAWAPADETVGFRNEFPLVDGDAVVEFCRWSVGREHVTWIGVFVRSVDAVYGDRQNHAGVGLWLRGERVVRALELLDALRQLAIAIAGGQEAAATEQGARLLMTNRYVGQYIQPASAFPESLSGWNYLDPINSLTAYRIAAAPTIDERLDLAAEQVTRMSFLPPESADTARALVLMTTPNPQRTFPRGHPEPVRRDATARILAEIPAIASSSIAQTTRSTAEIAALRGELEQASATLARRAAELAAAQDRIDTLTDHNQMLQGQIAQSDPLKAFNDILTRLNDMQAQGRATADRVASLDRQLRDKAIAPATPPIAQSRDPFDPPPQATRKRPAYAVPLTPRPRGLPIVPIVIGVLLLAVLLLGYIAISASRPDPVLDVPPATTTAPAPFETSPTDSPTRDATSPSYPPP